MKASPADSQAQPIDPTQPPKLIDLASYARIENDDKPGLLGGAHASFFNHKDLGDAMHAARMLGYKQAEADDREFWDVVVVLAHNDAQEAFFKDHGKFTNEERERMIAALSIEETAEYDLLVETEKAAKTPTEKVAAKTAVFRFEQEWGTKRWRWKQHAKHFAQGNEWAAWWIYKDDLKLDPIYNDPTHPWSAVWKDMTRLVDYRDGVKFLVLYGNSASVQVGVFPKEKKDAAESEVVAGSAESDAPFVSPPIEKTADEHMAELREAAGIKAPAGAVDGWIPTVPLR